MRSLVGVGPNSVYWDDNVILLQGQVVRKRILPRDIPENRANTSPIASSPTSLSPASASSSPVAGEAPSFEDVYEPEVLNPGTVLEIPFEFVLPPVIDGTRFSSLISHLSTGIPSLHPCFQIKNPPLVTYYQAYVRDAF